MGSLQFFNWKLLMKKYWCEKKCLSKKYWIGFLMLSHINNQFWMSLGDLFSILWQEKL